VKRSALHRRTPLGRGAPLTRSKPVRERNGKRAAKKHARNFGERAEAVRGMECLVPVAVRRKPDNEYPRWVMSPSYCCRPCDPVQAAHARARGMGGAKGNSSDLVPLCAKHHAEAGEYGTSQRADFERRYGIDLTAKAERIAIELDARGLPRAEPDKVQRKRDRSES
jgi:hypothetical protein